MGPLTLPLKTLPSAALRGAVPAALPQPGRGKRPPAGGGRRARAGPSAPCGRSPARAAASLSSLMRASVVFSYLVFSERSEGLAASERPFWSPRRIHSGVASAPQGAALRPRGPPEPRLSERSLRPGRVSVRPDQPRPWCRKGTRLHAEARRWLPEPAFDKSPSPSPSRPGAGVRVPFPTSPPPARLLRPPHGAFLRGSPRAGRECSSTWQTTRPPPRPRPAARRWVVALVSGSVVAGGAPPAPGPFRTRRRGRRRCPETADCAFEECPQS